MLGGSRDLNDAVMQQSCGDLLQTKYEIKRVVDKREKYISRKWMSHTLHRRYAKIIHLIAKIKFNILWLSSEDEKYDRKSVLLTCTSQLLFLFYSSWWSSSSYGKVLSFNCVRWCY